MEPTVRSTVGYWWAIRWRRCASTNRAMPCARESVSSRRTGRHRGFSSRGPYDSTRRSDDSRAWRGVAAGSTSRRSGGSPVDLCDRLGVRRASLEQPVEELSGGNQQKVVIARWLGRDCDVLLFDEPTRGIDVAAKETVYRLLDELARAGKALVVASSEVEELLALCDRIAVMSAGRLAAVFERGDWSQERIMAAAFSGHVRGRERRRMSERRGLLAVLAVLLALFGALSDHFLTRITFVTLANQMPALVVIATGMTFVLVVGGIDLSVGSVLALGSALLGSALTAVGVAAAGRGAARARRRARRGRGQRPRDRAVGDSLVHRDARDAGGRARRRVPRHGLAVGVHRGTDRSDRRARAWARPLAGVPHRGAARDRGPARAVAHRVRTVRRGDRDQRRGGAPLRDRSAPGRSSSSSRCRDCSRDWAACSARRIWSPRTRTPGAGWSSRRSPRW